MKTLMALTLAAMILLPNIAFAGASTDAALGLGAFAVFNQMLGGVGLFGRPVAAQPVIVATPPVVVAPPPVQATVVYQQPVVISQPYPVYEPYPVYYRHRHVAMAPHWCPPGQGRKGRC